MVGEVYDFLSKVNCDFGGYILGLYIISWMSLIAFSIFWPIYKAVFGVRRSGSSPLDMFCHLEERDDPYPIFSPAVRKLNKLFPGPVGFFSRAVWKLDLEGIGTYWAWLIFFGLLGLPLFSVWVIPTLIAIMIALFTFGAFMLKKWYIYKTLNS